MPTAKKKNKSLTLQLAEVGAMKGKSPAVKKVKAVANAARKSSEKNANALFNSKLKKKLKGAKPNKKK